MDPASTLGDAPGTSSNQLWEAEYQAGGIPSSVRAEPSGAVVDFIEFARSQGVNAGVAFDAGCGGGRNAIYLASLGFDVVAMDYSPSQIVGLAETVKGLPPEFRLKAVVGDVRRPWPVAAGTVVNAIDAFCFKHQIADSDVQGYVQAATGALRRDGLLMISFAGRDDGYYAQFPVPGTSGPGQVILDPGNGILSRLYDADEAAALFQAFAVEKSITKHNSNTMHGRTYPRETHVLYLRRSS
jgi:SAM-dependent methyltransferase